ncbi:MAG: hypothetical protein KFH98_02080 [Gemmatimonadetes bacterium]|nr:hypothetical protein [Gemmatimonadota bacterium]
MTPRQFERLMDRLADIRNTDELYDLEQRLAPFDEDDVVARRALFHLAAARCQLARGPALSPERFTLTHPAPARSHEEFQLRGRLGTRIVRVGWADGEWYGSLHAIALLAGDHERFADAATARRHVLERMDVVLGEGRELAVA